MRVANKHSNCDIQSKMLELQPSSHVREKSGTICKIHAKYSARAARSLAMQIRKSLAESHPRVTSMQISEDESHLSTSQSHPGVTSAKNSEASHIRWSHPRVTSGQNPVTSRGAPYPIAALRLADSSAMLMRLRSRARRSRRRRAAPGRRSATAARGCSARLGVAQRSLPAALRLPWCAASSCQRSSLAIGAFESAHSR